MALTLRGSIAIERWCGEQASRPLGLSIVLIRIEGCRNWFAHSAQGDSLVCVNGVQDIRRLFSNVPSPSCLGLKIPRTQETTPQVAVNAEQCSMAALRMASADGHLIGA